MDARNRQTNTCEKGLSYTDLVHGKVMVHRTGGADMGYDAQIHRLELNAVIDMQGKADAFVRRIPCQLRNN